MRIAQAQVHQSQQIVVREFRFLKIPAEDRNRGHSEILMYRNCLKDSQMPKYHK